MPEKKDPVYSSNNKGKDRSAEEQEQVFSEEVEEKSTFDKLKANKKVTTTLFIILMIGGFVYLFRPNEEKETPKKDVQTSEKIEIDMLAKQKTEEEELNNNNQSNGNQQGYFPYADNNLQSSDVQNLDMPKSNQSDHIYGDYPSYYSMDELPDDDYSTGSTKKQQSEKIKSSPISFTRGNTQTSATSQGTEQTETQPQGQSQSNQKNTFQLGSGLTAPKSPYEIKTGELIPAVLVTGIDSDLSGNITAIVREDVYDSIKGKYLLIPKGSKLYGTYDSNIIYGQNRLMLIWQRIILPNGYTINLETMQGIDMTGQAGIKGKVNNHTLKLLRSVVLSALFNFVSSGVGVTYNNNVGSSDNVSVSATMGKDVTDDVSSQIKNAGDMMVARDLSQQPTIKIKAGTKFSIMVNNDMVLVPYNKLKGSK